MKNIRFNKFNEKLRGEESDQLRGEASDNWRNLKTPEVSDVPAEYERILESPVEFSMENGRISKIQISHNEPQWSVNFKKSLISLMKVKTPTGEQDLSQNTIEIGSLPQIWRIMEESVDGKCENTYHVTELPEYMLSETTFGLVNAEKCQGKKVFQIMKSRDVDKCVERTKYSVNQPGKHMCSTGNCDTMWQRSSITRYIGCGSSPESMELQIIFNEGEIQQNLLAYNTENVVTGTMQTLKMVEIRSSLSSLPLVESPRNVDDLFYEYSMPGHIQQQGQQGQQDQYQQYKYQKFMAQQYQNQQYQQTSGEFQPPVFAVTKVPQDKLKQLIVKGLEKLSHDLKEVEEFEKKHASHTVLALTKIFSQLSTESMKSLYEEVKGLSSNEEDREITRQLFLEISVMSGTNPSIMFLKEIIESEEISPLRTGVTIAMLPHYIKTPSVRILDQLFELIKSPAVTKHELLRSNAQLAFATLLNKVCIDCEKSLRFPEFVYGEFCNSQTSELTTKYIPYLVNQLQSATSSTERQSIMVTLGALGHESIVSILLPYIEGRAEKCTPVEQRVAIYSLGSVARRYREVLKPIYSSLVHNPSEDRTVRIAALSIMLNMEPTMVDFQKLATSTWFEKDSEFHKFVFSTLKSLSKIEVTEMLEYRYLRSMCNKARVVFHLAKPVPGVISSTLNYFVAEWLKELQVGYKANGFYSTVSNMQTVYGKFEYFLQKLKFSPIEFSVSLEGTSQLMQKINKIIGGSDSPLDKIHPEWREIISSIDLTPLEETPLNSRVWAKLFDDVQFVYGMDSQVVEPMLQSIKRAIAEPQNLKQKVCGRTPLNFVKAVDFAPTQVLIPSEMGFPIRIELHMPALLSVRGSVHCDCSGSSPSVSLEVSNKLSTTLTGYVGTVCPFTDEVIAVGIDEHWAVNYPTKLALKMEMGKMKVVITPVKEVTSSTKAIDLFSYTVRPYATIKPVIFRDAIPLGHHENSKTIKSEGERKTEELQYGESLGLDAKIIMTSETDIRDYFSLMQHMKLYKYNPINMMLFSWTRTAMRIDGKPSSRFMEVKMVYDPSRSSTKEVEIDLVMVLGHKVNGEYPKLVSLAQLAQAKQQQTPYQGEELQASNKYHQKIDQCLQQLNVDQGYGLTTSIDVVFKGASQKTFSWQLTTGHGQKELEQKWNLHLEDKQSMNICVDGSVTLPFMPLRDISMIRSDKVRFSYKNTIGFGKTCEEHRIKVTGTSSVSENQKQAAESSKSSRKCEESKKKIHEIREQLKSVSEDSHEYRTLEEELMRYVEEKNEFCRQQRQQLSTLDEVKFRIEYTPMPEYIRRYARFVDTFVKGGLLPFMTKYESTHNENIIKVELKFHTHHNTVDMALDTETDSIKYSNIRLPEKLRSVLPLIATERVAEQVISQLQGVNVYPKCTIGDEIVKSYDNTTYRYQLDDCYYVLASDCSKNFRHAVLGKVVEGKKHITIYTEGSKITMKPSASYSESRREVEIEVDGQSIQLNRNEKKQLRSQDVKTHYELTRLVYILLI